jgi:hypothetical protein
MNQVTSTQLNSAVFSARWLAEIEGELMDISAMREQISASAESIEEIDEKFYLISPFLDTCKVAAEARVVALELIYDLNVSVALVYSDHNDIRLGVIAEWMNGSLTRHYTMSAEPGVFRLRLGNVKVFVNGKESPDVQSIQTIADRARLLLRSNSDVRAALILLHKYPVTWSNLYIVFETVKRLTTPPGKKADHVPLMNWGWADKNELDRLYETAKFYRHGFPREPLKCLELSMDDAKSLVRRLVMKLVNHLSRMDNVIDRTRQ